MNCFPEIGLLMAEDRNLGKFENHQWIKDKMSIIIDSNAAWNERTAVSKYSNGFESTIIGNERIIHELKSGREVKISPFPGVTHFVFSLNGSKGAIERAKSACR